MGNPTFCFSFTSDDFDIYLVNDALRERGWRMNGQQYPNSIHMCVTRPQTLPGVREAWTGALAESVEHARAAQGRAGEEQLDLRRYSRAAGRTEADEFIRAVMADMMDKHQALPD